MREKRSWRTRYPVDSLNFTRTSTVYAIVFKLDLVLAGILEIKYRCAAVVQREQYSSHVHPICLFAQFSRRTADCLGPTASGLQPEQP